MNTTADNAIIRTRLAALRTTMQANNVDACLIPSSDPHLSEYLPLHWQGRKWLSGFTGSVATLIVTADFAGLWVDSRYWIQAEKELVGTGITQMNILTLAQANLAQWLAGHLKPEQTVAVDGDVLGLSTAKALQQTLSAHKIIFRTDLDLIASIYPDRPELPTKPVYEHTAPYATVSRQDKLVQVRAAMQDAGADWHLISTLDDIAWLLNLRGSDVNYNPVFISHAVVGKGNVTLFVGEGKISPELTQQLQQQGIAVQPYSSCKAFLQQLPQNDSILIDPRRVTYGLQQAIAKGMTVIEQTNPSTLLKSRKTAEEASHIRQAMEQDGAALCEFFAWFDQAVNRDDITELTIDEHITAARARQPGFVCPSFATIAGFNENGALPHYHATEAAHSHIKGNGLLLIDSGGQYLNGTTDITRVVPVGTPSAEQKRDFTLVLKGVINLSVAHFPRGTLSPMLDSLARAPLWQEGIDFGHGTGHGVGYFMNVHEGPQSISRTLPEAIMAMEPGMVTSIEPGVYRPGKWGVRIENLVLNSATGTTECGEFLHFETLTLCPIDTRCIDTNLLTEQERQWLNHYHAEVRARLSQRVQGDALQWLMERTEAI